MPATTFDPDKADAVLRYLREGMTLPRACGMVGVPRPTFLDWVEADRDGLSDRYARARDFLLEYWADEVIEISDDGRSDYVQTEDGRDLVDHDHINRSKLRVETRKWLLSKLKPGKYGDKLGVHGVPGMPAAFVVDLTE